MRTDVPKRPMQVAVPEDMHQWLKAEGRRLDRSVNWIINRLIDDARKRAEQEKPEVAQ